MEVAELRHKLKTSLHKDDITRFRDTIDKHLVEAHGHAKFDDLPPAEQKAAKQVQHASHCLYITLDSEMTILQYLSLSLCCSVLCFHFIVACQAWRSSRITKELLVHVKNEIPDVWQRVKTVFD